MSIGIDGASGVNGVSAASGSGMSIQAMAALAMLEIGSTKKTQAQGHIEEMQEKNTRAKKLNAFLDKVNTAISGFTDDSDDTKTKRATAIKGLLEEAKTLGVTGEKMSNWSTWNASSLSLDQASAIKQEIQHSAENVNSDSQTQMIKLQDLIGQYNSFVSGAGDAIKQYTQILQSLAKN